VIRWNPLALQRADEGAPDKLGFFVPDRCKPMASVVRKAGPYQVIAAGF
jgi:hypothetical protein